MFIGLTIPVKRSIKLNNYIKKVKCLNIFIDLPMIVNVQFSEYNEIHNK